MEPPEVYVNLKHYTVLVDSVFILVRLEEWLQIELSFETINE